MAADDEKAPEIELTPQERMFVELVADVTDRRSIGDKAAAAGYTDTYGYVLRKKPHILKAINELVDAELRVLRARRASVLAAIADRAEGRGDISASDANKAAELYLRWTQDIVPGGVGINVASDGGAVRIYLPDNDRDAESDDA